MAASMASDPRTMYGSPFVGRDRELASLRARIAAARSGAGGVVLVSGPPGIGKTRTVEEAVAGLGDLPVVWGSCVDDPGAPPLWPWRRVLRALPAVQAAVAGALVDVDLRRAETADADAARFRFVAAATDSLLAAAHAAGLVVVLEDLHWADETSLRLVRHIASEVQGSRLLLVGTMRDPADGLGSGPLTSTVAELLRWSTSELVPLQPLTEEAVRAYLTATTAEVPPATSVREALRRSGGNPLYLRAVSRLDAVHDRSTAGADGVAELRHLVRITVANLTGQTRDVVAIASVLGEEINVELLVAVSRLPHADVVVAVDAAVRAGVLTAVPDAPGRRRFAHAVVRDGIYADLAPSLREELHERVASALELAADDDDALAGVVAGHWLRAAADAVVLRRAADWSRRAATAATRSLALDDAARFLTMALHAVVRASAGAEERAEVLLELATAEFGSGRFAQSLEHAAEASDTALAVGRDDLVVGAALVVHDVASPDLAARLMLLQRRALDRIDGGQHTATRARLLAQLASALVDVGQISSGAEHAAQALALAEACGDPVATIEAVQAKVKGNLFSLPVAERRRLGRLAVDLAATTGQPLAALWGHKWRIDAALEVGDMTAVDLELTQIGLLAATTRLPMVRWHDLRLRASVEALRGRFATASALNDEALELATTAMSEDLSAAGMSYAFRLQMAQMTGDIADLEAEEIVRSLQIARNVPIVRVSRALVYLLTGRRDEAVALYAEIRPLVRSPDFSTLAQGVPLFITPLVAEFRDAETAGFLMEKLKAHPVAAGAAGVFCVGSSARQLGILAAVTGRLDEAVGHLEEALDSNGRIGARPEVVLTRLDLTRVLLERDAPGDARRAYELAREAVDEARRLGMVIWVQAGTELLDRVRAAAADPLSAREREIAGLVASALTNRQIAERLVLSERTVESHVRNILSKLGVANRTEIATTVRTPDW